MNDLSALWSTNKTFGSTNRQDQPGQLTPRHRILLTAQFDGGRPSQSY